MNTGNTEGLWNGANHRYTQEQTSQKNILTSRHSSGKKLWMNEMNENKESTENKRHGSRSDQTTASPGWRLRDFPKYFWASKKTLGLSIKLSVTFKNTSIFFLNKKWKGTERFHQFNFTKIIFLNISLSYLKKWKHQLVWKHFTEFKLMASRVSDLSLRGPVQLISSFYSETLSEQLCMIHIK